jgi:hypothetical protein
MNNNRRNNKRKGAQLKRTRNGLAQNAAMASRQDAVPQLRKFMQFRNFLFTNATTNYAFGLDNINFVGSEETLSSILTEYSAQYEQYRIRRVKLRAQVGKGFTNDHRIKTFIAARVDVDNQLVGATPANVNSLLNAENACVKTFTERGNVLLADFRPVVRSVNQVSHPILPSQLQWYPIKDKDFHSWKGATCAFLIPEPSNT